jgi:transcriptional regulator with XRE-family HTH domain
MPKPHILCRIREVLDSKQLTQEWLSTEAKVDGGDLSRLTRGSRNPRVTTARRIARALGVPIEKLWPESVPKRHK